MSKKKSGKKSNDLEELEKNKVDDSLTSKKGRNKKKGKGKADDRSDEETGAAGEPKHTNISDDEAISSKSAPKKSQKKGIYCNIIICTIVTSDLFK